jgi:hypothetical protein
VEAPDFLDLLCSVPLQLLQGPAEVRTLILEQEMGRLMDEESDADGLDSEDELRIFDTMLAQTDDATDADADAVEPAAGDATQADAASSDSDAAATAAAVQSKADRKAEKKAKKADKKAAKAAAAVAAPVAAEQDDSEVQPHKSKRSKQA